MIKSNILIEWVNMETKFKNKDLLIKVLDRCIKCRYHISEMVNIRYMITNDNATFE